MQEKLVIGVRDSSGNHMAVDSLFATVYTAMGDTIVPNQELTGSGGRYPLDLLQHAKTSGGYL